MRRALGLVVIAAAVSVAAVALWKLRVPLVALLYGIALAGAAHPLVISLRKQGVPRGVALAAVYVGGMVAIGALGALVLGPLLEEVRRATDGLSLAYEQQLARWAQGSAGERALADGLPAPRTLYATVARLRPFALAEGAIGVGGAALELTSAALLAVVLSLFWATNRDRVERLGLAFLAPRQRARARTLLRDLEAGVGQVVFAEGAKLCLSLTALALGFELLGLPYATLPAVAAAVLGLVPYAGVALGVVAAGLAGLSVGPMAVAAAATYAMLALVAIHLFFVPGALSARRPHPILVMVALVALTGACGLVGLLLAAPAAAAIQIIAERFMAPERITAALPTDLAVAADRVARLRARAAQLPTVPPELGGLIERLTVLLGPTPAPQAQSQPQPQPQH